MTETAITDNSTISTDDLNRFETPRDPWGDPTGEPVPFTKPELRAIGAYNTRTAGIPDCFDQMDTNGFRDVPGEGFTFDDNVKRIKEHFVYLRQWLEALHDLGMDLGFNLGKPLSDTATRLFENEEQRFKRAHDDTRDAALHFFIGDAADVYQL